MEWYAWVILVYFTVGILLTIPVSIRGHKSSVWNSTNTLSKVLAAVIVVFIWPAALVYGQLIKSRQRKAIKNNPAMRVAGLIVPDGKGGHEVIHFGRRDQE